MALKNSREYIASIEDLALEAHLMGETDGLAPGRGA